MRPQAAKKNNMCLKMDHQHSDLTSHSPLQFFFLEWHEWDSNWWKGNWAGRYCPTAIRVPGSPAVSWIRVRASFDLQPNSKLLELEKHQSQNWWSIWTSCFHKQNQRQLFIDISKKQFSFTKTSFPKLRLSFKMFEHVFGNCFKQFHQSFCWVLHPFPETAFCRRFSREPISSSVSNGRKNKTGWFFLILLISIQIRFKPHQNHTKSNKQTKTKS